jgi:hypothetical protein
MAEELRPDAPLEDEVRAGEAPPPPFRSWGLLYGIVLLNLALLIAAFSVFTLYFR